MPQLCRHGLACMFKSEGPMGWIRWVVFDSPAEQPFRYGGVSWARNGGCQCSCADMAACAAEGRAPAWGMGLVAQHTCREQVDRVPVWHQVRRVP